MKPITQVLLPIAVVAAIIYGVTFISNYTDAPKDQPAVAGPEGKAKGAPEPPLSLHDLDYAAGGLTYPAHRHREPEARLESYLAEAERILADPVSALGPPPTPEALDVDTDFESLRWFWLPDEIAVELSPA